MKDKKEKNKILQSIGLFFGGSIISVLGSILLSTGLESISIILMLIGFAVMITGIVFIIKKIIQAIHNKTTEKHISPTMVTYADINSSNVNENYPKSIRARFSYNETIYAYADDNQTKLSWTLCLIFLFLFAPFGIYFIIRKIVKEKTLYYKNGVMLNIFGTIMLVISLICLVILKIGELSWFPFTFCLLFFVLGIPTYLKGRKNDKYMVLLTLNQITNIDELSKITNTSYAKVTKAVENLIDSGLLNGAYINHKDREIIVHGISKKVAHKCHNCGGTSVIYYNDSKKVCQYCGAKL